MGAGASSEGSYLKSSLKLFPDHPGVVFKLPPGAKQTIPLCIRDSDREKLLYAQDQGHLSYIEIVVTIGKGHLRYVYLGKFDNRRLHHLVPLAAQEVKLMLLASDSNSFSTGEHLVTLDNHTEHGPAIVTVSANTIIERPQALHEHVDELAEANRLLEEQLAEAQLVIRKLQAQLAVSTDSLQHEKQQRAKAIINSWRSRTVVPVFHAWRRWARESRERRQLVLGKIIKRMGQLQIWAAFRHWRIMAESEAQQEQNVKWRHQLEFEKRKRIEVLVKNWRMRSVTPVFLAWRTWAHENKLRKEQLLGKVIKRLQNAKAWAAWRQWTKVVEDEKMNDIRESLNRQRRARVEDLIKRWRYRTAISCFRAWSKFAHEQRLLKEREMTREEIERMRKETLARSQEERVVVEYKEREPVVDPEQQRRMEEMEKWKRQAEQEQTRRKTVVLGKIVRRMQNVSLWTAWRQWQLVIGKYREQDKDRQAKQEKKRKMRLMMMKWKKRGVKEAFIAWRDHVASQKLRRKEKLERVVKTMVHGAKWQAWKQWRLFVQHYERMEWKRQVEAEVKQRYGVQDVDRVVMTRTVQDFGLLPKYNNLKDKYRQLSHMYTRLFQFAVTFREEVTLQLSRNDIRFSHVCRCETCKAQRDAKARNGQTGWLTKYDSELREFRYIR